MGPVGKVEVGVSLFFRTSALKRQKLGMIPTEKATSVIFANLITSNSRIPYPSKIAECSVLIFRRRMFVFACLQME